MRPPLETAEMKDKSMASVEALDPYNLAVLPPPLKARPETVEVVVGSVLLALTP
jgi:hypothetical protein